MSGRRSVNIYDYPEHLNPFFEDDNHTKLRFWANTKRKPRSNSFSFQSIKDFKQTLFSRPVIRKRSGTTTSSRSTSSSLSQLSCYHTQEKNDDDNEFTRSDNKRKSLLRKLGRSFSIRSKTKKTRDASADRQSQNPENEAAYSYSRSTDVSNRQTMPSETYHRESITPLPRIRFHERLRNTTTATTATEVEKTSPTASSKGSAGAEVPGSPVDDKNPFKDEEDDVKIRVVTPSTSTSSSKPATPPRKKKRAPPPPPMRQSSLTRKSLSAEFNMCGQEHEDNASNEINHKDVERTETKVEVKEIPKIVIKSASTDQEEESQQKEEKDDKEKDEKEKDEKEKDEKQEKDEKEEVEEPFQLNYNSELNISTSQMSINSETRLEQQQQQSAVEDSSDLLELVQKLQIEVEKLTDDTNNNVIASTFNASKKANLYGYDDDAAATMGATEIHVAPNIRDNRDNRDIPDDDDNDVIVGAPLSPRFVRLRKDNEWIKH